MTEPIKEHITLAVMLIGLLVAGAAMVVAAVVGWYLYRDADDSYPDDPL